MHGRNAILAVSVVLMLLAGCAAPAAQPAPAPSKAAAPAATQPAAPAAASLPAAAAQPAAAPASPAKVTLAITAPVASFWPVFIATQEGFFSREALDVEVLYTQSGVRSVQTLAGGSADVAIPGPDAVLVANSKGAQL